MAKYKQMLFDPESMEMKPEPDIEMSEVQLAIIPKLPSFKIGHTRVPFEIRLPGTKFEAYCRLVHEKEKIAFIMKEAVPIAIITEQDARVLMQAGEVLKELIRTGEYAVQEKEADESEEDEDEDE